MNAGELAARLVDVDSTAAMALSSVCCAFLSFSFCLCPRPCAAVAFASWRVCVYCVEKALMAEV